MTTIKKYEVGEIVLVLELQEPDSTDRKHFATGNVELVFARGKKQISQVQADAIRRKMTPVQKITVTTRRLAIYNSSIKTMQDKIDVAEEFVYQLGRLLRLRGDTQTSKRQSKPPATIRRSPVLHL